MALAPLLAATLDWRMIKLVYELQCKDSYRCAVHSHHVQPNGCIHSINLEVKSSRFRETPS